MINEQNIIDQIVLLLKSIEDEEEEKVLQQVEDHIPSQWTSYPACYVVPASWTETFLDLRDTQNEMVFTIGIVYTLDPDMESGQKELRQAVIAVRDVLKKQKNIDFNNTVDWSELTSGIYTYDTRETKLAICEMTLTVRGSYSRYEN